MTARDESRYADELQVYNGVSNPAIASECCVVFREEREGKHPKQQQGTSQAAEYPKLNWHIAGSHGKSPPIKG